MSRVTVAIVATGLFALLVGDRQAAVHAQAGTQYVVGVSGMT